MSDRQWLVIALTYSTGYLRYKGYLAAKCCHKFPHLFSHRFIYSVIHCFAVIKETAGAGDIALLDWLVKNGASLNHNPNYQERKSMDYDMFEISWDFYREIEFLEADVYPADWASRFGQLETLRWILSHGGKCSVSSCQEAASNGHLHILEFFHQHHNKNYFTIYVATSAAKYGHLHILKWLKENNVLDEWEDTIAESAASCGQLNTLQWLLEEEGFKITDSVYWKANNQPHVIQWIKEHGTHHIVEMIRYPKYVY